MFSTDFEKEKRERDEKKAQLIKQMEELEKAEKEAETKLAKRKSMADGSPLAYVSPQNSNFSLILKFLDKTEISQQN